MTESLSENYRRGGFGGALAFGTRPALLVIDFVKAYLDKSSPLYAGVEQARAERRVVTLASHEGSTIPANAIEYLNRLGDLLFVLARVSNRQAGVTDDPWIHP